MKERFAENMDKIRSTFSRLGLRRSGVKGPEGRIEISEKTILEDMQQDWSLDMIKTKAKRVKNDKRPLKIFNLYRGEYQGEDDPQLAKDIAERGPSNLLPIVLFNMGDVEVAIKNELLYKYWTDKAQFLLNRQNAALIVSSRQRFDEVDYDGPESSH